MRGRVVILGAGPGDPELITLKAARLLNHADTVLYDRLVHPAILEHARPAAERIFVGKRRALHHVRQSAIHELLIGHARQGRLVARLKGGDPMIFGRIGEEVSALLEAGVPFEIVPGVTAASGCAAEGVIPLTHRDHSHMVLFATGHSKDGEPDLDWPGLCGSGRTLVFYMGHSVLDRLCAQLIAHGLPAGLPACLIENGTLDERRRIDGTLETLPARVHGSYARSPGPNGPALVIVGTVTGLFGDRGGRDPLSQWPSPPFNFEA